MRGPGDQRPHRETVLRLRPVVLHRGGCLRRHRPVARVGEQRARDEHDRRGAAVHRAAQGDFETDLGGQAADHEQAELGGVVRHLGIERDLGETRVQRLVLDGGEAHAAVFDLDGEAVHGVLRADHDLEVRRRVARAVLDQFGEHVGELARHRRDDARVGEEVLVDALVAGRFARRVHEEVRDVRGLLVRAADRTAGQHLEILDLAAQPDGLVVQAVELADQFGVPVVLAHEHFELVQLDTDQDDRAAGYALGEPFEALPFAVHQLGAVGRLPGQRGHRVADLADFVLGVGGLREDRRVDLLAALERGDDAGQLVLREVQRVLAQCVRAPQDGTDGEHDQQHDEQHRGGAGPGQPPRAVAQVGGLAEGVVQQALDTGDVQPGARAAQLVAGGLPLVDLVRQDDPAVRAALCREMTRSSMRVWVAHAGDDTRAS